MLSEYQTAGSDKSAHTYAFHYVSSRRIENGDFIENYPLSKVNVMSEAKEVDVLEQSF